MRRTPFLSAAIWGLTAALWAQPKLTLEEYLRQVQSQGPGFKSAQSEAEGYRRQSAQQVLLYSPVLSASYNHLDDQQQQPNPFAPSETMADNMGVSLVDKLPFGPSLALGYTLNNVNLVYSPALLKSFGSGSFLSSYFQVSPVVSLSVPLFKDFGGIQTSAGVNKFRYQLESASFQAAFQGEQILFSAKVAYWSLALSRAEVSIRQDTLGRSRKIWDWTRRRVARNLADSPDALQAEASVRVAELDLQTAQERERSARLSFNRFRDVLKSEVPERLESLEESLAGLRVEFPNNLPDRLDLKAVEGSARQLRAAYDEASQNIFPDITAYASWRGNGLDPAFSPANTTAFQYSHPSYAIGAQFNLSLDVFTASRVSEGYKLQSEGAQSALQDKKIQMTQEWRDLKDRMRDVEKRLGMAAQIEEIQRKKADQEKTRLSLGRTTQFQLLSFENDYSLARLNRLALVLEKLSALAQAQWWLAVK